MKFNVKIKNCNKELENLLNFNEEKHKILKKNHFKRLINILIKNLKLVKLRIEIGHEELKQIYGDIVKSKEEDANIKGLMRNILIYLGIIIMTDDNMINLRNMIYNFGNLTEFIDENNYFIKQKSREFLNKIIIIVNNYETMKKNSFKLNNRLIIIKNYK